MRTSDLVFTTTLCGLLLVLTLVVLWLLRTVLKEKDRAASLGLTYIQALTLENQSLRNQLRATSLPELAGLNEVTLPSQTQAAPSNFSTDVALLEDEFVNGYQPGELSDDLNAGGWDSPYVAKGDDGAVDFRTV